MNKSALQDIQQALNAIRSEIKRVDDETKWAALELMLGTSSNVVALAKKIAKLEKKTVRRCRNTLVTYNTLRQT
jgi:phage-related minor tail protein